MDTVSIDSASLYSHLGSPRAPLILDLAPQCAGLVATSLGLSRRFQDDHEMLAQAMPVYDGLFAWCKGQVEGDTERHSWNPAA